MCNRVFVAILTIFIVGLLSACAAPKPLAPTPPALAKELVFYDWENDMPQSVLDAFTAEYGVKVTYLTYESPEDAVRNIRAGKVYDVAIIENQLIPMLVAEQLLAEIDFGNVPNFKNISANFRDLGSDPGNKHTVPYNWGTTGLVVRADLAESVTKWADLWDPRYAGKLVIWNSQRYVIGIALKSLGYSVNSEKPDELNAALERLFKLKASASIVGYDPIIGTDALISGETAMIYGWANDFVLAREKNDTIRYILPQEGTILWGDNYVIPANSPNKYTTELFINFVMRPEINAEITNKIHYATPNDAARSFIKPEILNDPVIFPPNVTLKNAEIVLPLSPAGQKLHDAIWQRFMDTGK